jgi:hypothetical protein
MCRFNDDDNTPIWKIAVGVAIGILTAAMVLLLVDRIRTQMAIDEATRFFQSLTKGLQDSSARTAEHARRRDAQRATAEQAGPAREGIAAAQHRGI